ncbi:MAG TPA: shikimate kinase [Rhodanobacteraceae bacterium]|jgi:shikimate kinase|nr:shikimate kinase [Rhodanobacteraceae bacterium]
MNPAPNLIFIGPMGAGKTTVGRHVAELLAMPFHDLDHEIEAHTGAAISLVFDLEGEAGFRRRETTTLEELAAASGIVLSTGGGAVLSEANRRVLRERGFVIWLDATIEAQLARLARDRQRPLLHAPDRRARLEELCAERNPLYAEVADLRIASSGTGNSSHTARHIVGILETQWQRGNTGAAA